MPRPKRHVKWARGDWILFIQIYRKHDCLWDTNKRASQQEIKDALQDLKEYFRIKIKDLTITDIKMRIKVLKNKYAREKKRVEFLKKNDMPVFLKPWFKVADGFLSDETKRLNETEIKITTYQRTNSWEQKKKLDTDAAVLDDKGKNEVVPNISAKIEKSDWQTLDITKIWKKKVITTYQTPKSNRKEGSEVGKQNKTTEEARMQFKNKDEEVFGQEIMKITREDSLEEEQADLQFLKLYKQHICLWNINYRHHMAVKAAYSDIIDRMEQWGKPGMTRKDIDRIEARIKCGYLKEKKQVTFLREKGYSESVIIVPLWYDFAKEFFETHIRDDNHLNIKKYKSMKCEKLQTTTVAKSEANVPARESREMFILTEPKNEPPEHLNRNPSMGNQIECVQTNKSTKEETNTVIETVQNEETELVDNKMNNDIPTNGKPPTWDRERTIRIIQLLKEHKCLWKNFACPIAREAAKLDIVNRLKIPGLKPEHVERKITGIKCVYRRERIKYVNTTNKFFFPKIYWYDLVDDFLRPYCKRTGPTTLCPPTVIDKPQPVMSGRIKYINQYSKMYKSLCPSETTIDIDFGSMGSYEPEEASVQETPQKVERILNSKTMVKKMVIATPKPIEDQFYLFANSLVTELRDMPDDQASTLQSDIKSMIIRRKWFLKQGYTTLNNSYGSLFFDPGPTKFCLNSGDNKDVHELLLPTVKFGSVVNTQDQDYPIADIVKLEEEEEIVLGS